MTSPPAPRSPFLLAAAGLALLLLGGAAGWLIESARGGLDPAGFNARVHAYIVEHPEVLVEAAQNLKTQGTEKQLADIADQVERPFPGAVLGNPRGKVTLVEFTDFACTYCRSSVVDVEALIAANPDLRVVIRELPIIAPTSAMAARWAWQRPSRASIPHFTRRCLPPGGQIKPASRRRRELPGSILTAPALLLPTHAPPPKSRQMLALPASWGSMAPPAG